MAVLGGNIIHTTDGGASWDVNEDMNTAEWADVSCSADGTRVVAVSSEGYIYYSSDSGAFFDPSDNDTGYEFTSVASSRSVSFFCPTLASLPVPSPRPRRSPLPASPSSQPLTSPPPLTHTHTPTHTHTHTHTHAPAAPAR